MSTFFRPGLRFLPLVTPETVQRGVLGISTDIARQDIDVYCRDVEFSLFGIVDYEELILLVVDLQPLKPAESPDPVFQMNDRVTGMEFCD